MYFATSAGVVAAFSDTGRQLWRVKVGKLEHVCKQLPGYGVTGTPVADPVTHSLYFVDGVGRLHGLDLETGKERAGWPVRLYTDFRQELVWGALTAIRGSLYFGTGSYCDAPMVGKIFRVDARTRDVSHWDVVPQEHGGGGGDLGLGRDRVQRGATVAAGGHREMPSAGARTTVIRSASRSPTASTWSSSRSRYGCEPPAIPPGSPRRTISTSSAPRSS